MSWTTVSGGGNITLGTGTTGDYISTITGGNGITSTGATSGENIAHSLSVDTKANGGLVFESNKLAVKLDHNNITGKLAASDGGTGHDNYTIGQLLVANSTSSLTKLTPGTSGYFLKSEGAGSPLVWSNVAAVGSSTPAALSAGDFLVGGPFNGASAATFNVQGDTANTANKLVARDGSGDIIVSKINATTIDLGGVSDTTLVRSSPGVVTIEGNEIRTGTVPIAKGGTGATTLVDLITLGTHTTGNYVTSITGGDGITAGGATEGGTPTVAIDLKTSGGLEFNGGQIRVKIDDSGINGVLPVAKGGTGVTSGLTALNATNLTSGAVAIARGGTGVTSGLTALNATNLTSGTVNTLRGGTGITGGYSAGDILYATNSTTLSKLNKGDDGKVLTLASGLPTWAAATGSSGGSYWTEHTNGTDVYRTSGNVGIGTTNPVYPLDVNGDIRTTSEGGFRGNGGNITGINITSERNETIINFGQQSSLKKSINGDPL